MEYNKKRIGNRLKSLRIDQGLDLEKLSNMSTVPQSTIQSYEQGVAVMGLKNAVKLADALDCSLDRLACRVD